MDPLAGLGGVNYDGYLNDPAFAVGMPVPGDSKGAGKQKATKPAKAPTAVDAAKEQVEELRLGNAKLHEQLRREDLLEKAEKREEGRRTIRTRLTAVSKIERYRKEMKLQGSGLRINANTPIEELNEEIKLLEEEANVRRSGNVINGVTTTVLAAAESAAPKLVTAVGADPRIWNFSGVTKTWQESLEGPDGAATRDLMTHLNIKYCDWLTSGPELAYASAIVQVFYATMRKNVDVFAMEVIQDEALDAELATLNPSVEKQPAPSDGSLDPDPLGQPPVSSSAADAKGAGKGKAKKSKSKARE